LVEQRLREALRADSTFADALRELGQLQIRRGDYKGAAGSFERLCSLPGNSPACGKTLAVLYYHAGDYKRAEGLLLDLLGQDVADYELHFYLGLTAAAKRDDSLASMEFEKTLVLRPGHSDAWRQLVNLYAKRKEFDRALEAAKRSLGVTEKQPWPWRLLGYVRNLRKEFPEASEALRRSLALDSTDAATWFEYGASLERQGKIGEAADVFRKVLAMDPGDPAAANYLGYMWADHDMHLDSARILLQVALARDSGNGAYLDSYAWIFHKLGVQDSAYYYIRKAVDKIGDDPTVLDHLGDILMRRNELRAAAEAYEKALRLGPDDAEKVRRKIEALGRRPPNVK
jgi:tetratricopeptide (TPR) repeat protein